MTAAITCKLGGPSTAAPSGNLDFLQYLCDCAIVLEHALDEGISQRSLYVLKYRGSAFDENRIPFLIGESGIETALARAGEEALAPVTDERVSSGVARLDTMLGGGYHRGASILITGAPGTAKTTLCGAFAEAACARGERTLYVSFDSHGAEIVRNLKSVGIDLAPHVESGALRLVSARSIRGARGTLIGLIRRARSTGALPGGGSDFGDRATGQRGVGAQHGGAADRLDEGDGAYAVVHEPSRRFRANTGGDAAPDIDHSGHVDAPDVPGTRRGAEPGDQHCEIAGHGALEPGPGASAAARGRGSGGRLPGGRRGSDGIAPAGKGAGGGARAPCGGGSRAGAGPAGRGGGGSESRIAQLSRNWNACGLDARRCRGQAGGARAGLASGGASGDSRRGSRWRGGLHMNASVHRICLYVAGDSPNSRLARANLAAIAGESFPEGWEVEVVDVFEHPDRALADGVLLTPMLVADPGSRVIGTLAETAAVLAALGLEGSR